VPTDKESTFFTFMDPLGLNIWLLVMAAFSLACFTLFTLARFSPYEWQNPRPWLPRPDYLVNQFSLANSFWFITGTLLRQGSGINPKVDHPILVLSISKVACFFLTLYPFFDGNLTLIPRDLLLFIPCCQNFFLNVHPCSPRPYHILCRNAIVFLLGLKILFHQL